MSESARLGRRRFLCATGIGAAGAVLSQGRSTGAATPQPNVILILTDDQGYGDLGCHGNEKLRTPNIDRFARESVECTRFHASPVCAPTRASLMTGRYNYRTRAIDTYLGRAMMDPAEVTIAEMLGAAGYETGIFGKWHLGDNYPMRPMDKGFHETLVHRGGGIGQPSDLPGGSHYTNPVLLHNGKVGQFEGYCMDVYTDAAMHFIGSHRDRPFFAYLATNTPHTPLEIAEIYAAPYRAMGLSDTTARIYGMIANIDENVGRLLAHVKLLGLEENTIVIFMTDNGAQQRDRYAAGLRAGKGTVYDGGIRVPFFMRWPRRFPSGRKMDRIAAHIDVVPTLLEACGIQKPSGVALDGSSLLPLLEGRETAWPERNLFFQWHRGDAPQLHRDCCVRSERWKLVSKIDKGGDPLTELYDMTADPGETTNLAQAHQELVMQMRGKYEGWFRDVSSTRGYDPPRIHLGTPHENPSTLTRQDWRGPRAGWDADSLGYWEVLVTAGGNYEVAVQFAPLQRSGEVIVKLGNASAYKRLDAGSTTAVLGPVQFEAGAGRFEASVQSAGSVTGVHSADVRRLAY